MKIGIIGAGNIGGTLAGLWAQAGHQVMVSSRHPERLQDLVSRLGDNVCSGTSEEAAAFGEVVFLAIPLNGMDTTVKKIKPSLAGKVVLDAMNPFENRDGDIARRALEKGSSGAYTAGVLDNAHVARAFSSVHYTSLQSEANRDGDRIAVPIAADDDDTKQTAARLVRDAGFVPFDLGRLLESQPLDPGGALFGKALTVKGTARALA
jgi:8-hydroxy-5-deazaflavin:NADPH oxidoreductase